MIRVAMLACALAGCLAEEAVTCGGGAICPAGTSCATLAALPTDEPPLCLDPRDVGSCTDAGAPCTTGAGVAGTCFEAPEGTTCVAAACGDHLIDVSEACDDGNQLAGDGCAADCRSDETCGNGVRDGVAFEQCDDGNLIGHDGCASGCRPEAAVWSRLDIDQMPPRDSAAMAYDPTRGVAVLFGGAHNGSPVEFYDDTWLWNGQSWARVNPTTRPSARADARMAYDIARGRMVLFGGLGPEGSLGDTWEWDGANWIRRGTADAPPPRAQMQIAYDGKRKRVVLFGGIRFDGGVASPAPTDDTWEWDGTQWKNVTPAAPAANPPARAAGAMAFDPVRGRIVMFGGLLGGGFAPADVWEYDGSWHKVTAAGPSARRGISMAYDAAAKRTLLFGGLDASGTRDDLWSWNGTAWQQLPPTTRPPPRTFHSVAEDTRRGRLVVVGGLDEPAVTTWEWDGTRWSGGALVDPGKRQYPGVAYDPLRRRAVLVDRGGTTWESDGASWIATTATAPTGAPLAFDPVRKKVVLFGGVDMNQSDETYAWNGTTWTAVSVPTRPSFRRGHSMGADAARGQVVMFGGVGFLGVSGDTWYLDAAGWHAAASGGPGLLSDAVMGYDPVRGTLLMFGGIDDNLVLHNETWAWNGTRWEDHSGPASARPLARAGAGMAYDAARGRLLMFGGGDGIRGTQTDLWEWGRYDLGRFIEGWVLVDTDASPSPRRDHAMFPEANGAGVVVAGGVGPTLSANAVLGDSWSLRWQNATPDQACIDPMNDQDHDGSAGCADPDCWSSCSPSCPPRPAGGVACDASAARCGDGTCSAVETCRMCPGDCGPCTPVCGDGFCDPGETCLGDCP